jgi:hypothetical protein
MYQAYRAQCAGQPRCATFKKYVEEQTGFKVYEMDTAVIFSLEIEDECEALAFVMANLND